ncbi:MAG: hypothetical protein ACRDN1_22760 [Trebonia sp.]
MPMAFRSRLVAREPLYGAWSVISSPLSVRLLAAAGLDYVVIDLQHGEATEADLPGLTSAVRLAGSAPVARVRHAHTADIGRALDLGCEGLRRVWAACAAAGKPAGVHAADGVTARRYREAGCTLVTTAVDATAITRDTAAQLGLARTSSAEG